VWERRISPRRVPREPIVQREEDGQFQVGWQDNAPGPFPSRAWAEAIASSDTGDPLKRRSPAAANGRAIAIVQSLAASEPSKYYPGESHARAKADFVHEVLA
jgi:hypothetical protein